MTRPLSSRAFVALLGVALALVLAPSSHADSGFYSGGGAAGMAVSGYFTSPADEGAYWGAGLSGNSFIANGDVQPTTGGSQSRFTLEPVFTIP